MTQSVRAACWCIARLDGWAGRRTERAEHAAIARLWPYKLAAACAVVEELTGVGWHDLHLLGAATGTADRRFKNHRHPFTHRGTRAPPKRRRAIAHSSRRW